MTGKINNMQVDNVQPSAMAEVANNLSHGFDIFGKDVDSSIMPTAIFDFHSCSKIKQAHDSLEYNLPCFVQFIPAHSVESVYGSSSDLSIVEQKMSSSLGIGIESGVFNSEVKSSYSHSSMRKHGCRYAYFSAVVNLGKLYLQTPDRKYLSELFIKDLEKLPDSFSGQNMPRFQDFFARYGLYYITHFDVGARLDMFKSVLETEETTNSDISACIAAQYEGLFIKGSIDSNITSEKSWENYSSSSKTILKARGGSLDAIGKLTAVDAAKPGQDTVSAYKDWLKSVGENPVACNFRLSSIANLCGEKQEAVTQAMEASVVRMKFKTSVELNYAYSPPAELLTTKGGYSEKDIKKVSYISKVKTDVYVNNILVLPADSLGVRRKHAGFHVVVFEKNNYRKMPINQDYKIDLEAMSSLCDMKRVCDWWHNENPESDKLSKLRNQLYAPMQRDLSDYNTEKYAVILSVVILIILCSQQRISKIT